MVTPGQSAALPPPHLKPERQRQGFVFVHRDEMSTTLESEANLTGENGATGFGSSLPVLGF